MTFVYPEAFILLIVVVILGFLKKNSKVILLEKIFKKEVLEKLEVKKSKYSNKNMKFFLAILSLILIIFTLSRPIILKEKKGQEVTYKSFDIAVILDISKSMEAKDVFPNRLTFAKKSLDKIMSNMTEANMAVVAFRNDAFLVSPFSNDFASIKFLLSNLNINSLSSQGSQIISALKATNKIYKSTNDSKKIVLLVSDGADGQDMNEISKYVKEHNIVLHVLSVGTKKGTTLSDGNGGFIKDKKGNIVISKRDDKILKIATSSGGSYLSLSEDMSKLGWLSRQIKATAEQKQMKKDKYSGAKELFYYPLSLALLLIFFVFNSPKIPFLICLLFINTNAKAGMFDFWENYQANQSYKAKQYDKAAEHFNKIEKNEAIYNKANALYKQKKYKEALSAYQSIKSFKGDKELQRLYDEGNTYAKMKKIDKAIKSYESALKIKDDADVKHNLEVLKKQKKQQQKKQNKKQDKKQSKKDQNKKQDNNQQNKKPDKSSKQNKQQKSNEKKNQHEKSPQKTQTKPQKISEMEAKKWEKQMQNKNFTTKPVKLQAAQGGNKNEINW